MNSPSARAIALARACVGRFRVHEDVDSPDLEAVFELARQAIELSARSTMWYLACRSGSRETAERATVVFRDSIEQLGAVVVRLAKLEEANQNTEIGGSNDGQDG